MGSLSVEVQPVGGGAADSASLVAFKGLAQQGLDRRGLASVAAARHHDDLGPHYGLRPGCRVRGPP
jgi:hypothetical protein